MEGGNVSVWNPSSVIAGGQGQASYSVDNSRRGITINLKLYNSHQI